MEPDWNLMARVMQRRGAAGTEEDIEAALMESSGLMYPPDGGLRPQVRPFDETFSMWTAIKRHFFPS